MSLNTSVMGDLQSCSIATPPCCPHFPYVQSESIFNPSLNIVKLKRVQFKTVDTFLVTWGIGKVCLSYRRPLGIERLQSGPLLHFPGSTNPSLSSCFHRKGVPRLWSVLWPYCGPVLIWLCFSGAGVHRARHSTPGEVSQQQTREGEWYPVTWWAQDAVGLLVCKCLLLAHVQHLVQQFMQILFHNVPLNQFIPQSVLIMGFAQPTCKTLHFTLFHLWAFQAWQCHSLWMASFPAGVGSALLSLVLFISWRCN